MGNPKRNLIYTLFSKLQFEGGRKTPGPGMELIGEEEKKEIMEVLEAGYLFRYGSEENPAFKAKVYFDFGK